MGFDFIFMMVQMIFALGIILLLMLLAYKLSSNKINSINKNKYIKVLERTQISKDTYITVVKVGKKGYVMSLSAGKSEVIEEICEEEIIKMEEMKSLEMEKVQANYDEIIVKVKEVLKKVNSKFKLKEENNEK